MSLDEFHGANLTAREREVFRLAVAAYPAFDDSDGFGRFERWSFEGGVIRALVLLRADFEELDELRERVRRTGESLIRMGSGC